MLDPIDVRYFKQIVGSNIGKETAVDVSARCPVCGDSKKNKNTKRLHLYIKGGLTLVNCFNCEVHSNMYNFIKSYKSELLDSYKKETFSKTLNSIRSESSDWDSIVLDPEPKSGVNWEDSEIAVHKDNKSAEVIKAGEIQEHDLTQFFQNIETSQEALSYLENRGIIYNNIKHLVGQFYISNTDIRIGELTYSIKDSVIIPLYYDKMYGFYSRKIKDKFFATYNPEMNLGYKIWNWFKIDKSKPVYIFESVFCALSAISSGLENSIALMSAKIPPERLNELTSPIFVLDNDKTGIVNAIEYSKVPRAEIFIYPEYITSAGVKDINELYLLYFNGILDIISNNLYSGLSAEVRLKNLL